MVPVVMIAAILLYLGLIVGMFGGVLGVAFFAALAGAVAGEGAVALSFVLGNLLAILFHDLVDPRRAIALRRFVVLRQVERHGDRVIL